ncbi:Mg/Co/Ni transporter, MgtE family [Campylobacter volucris]|uniref:Magnesium transporter MgtE n=1 Tax=Campylobacter volucris TaxID=1031542 RepID=A0AAE6CZT7_9BACT|nr:magnesium transporter [Campylobacter volucris]AJC94500.1 Mg/Co/Ni transporter, MgtE family [Campylobacter volucris LMG 24379]KAB0578056.1 Mg/Co/Ni transporter, MgtE family [Campylobacter volucris]MBF7042272.1 Mg/Co/Ni transporter, MgtE family [Campylobacter volucris]MBF7043550.1 Mg/Co/Ni transporter, MgtE family [Campylobacter volucris]MBF7047974.1 Mg/Co/Ni transporter, MgtE family [Campylobacter volucris]
MSSDFLKAQELLKNISNNQSTYEINEALKTIKRHDENLFLQTLNSLDTFTLANIATITPEYILEDILEHLSIAKIAKAVEELESDDATDLIKRFEEINPQKTLTILNRLSSEDKEEILRLKNYDENTAGAYMQTEIFTASLDESIEKAIKRYRILKKSEKIDQIFQIYITDKDGKLCNSINLSDLLLWDFKLSFADIIKNNTNKYKSYSVKDYDDIQMAIDMVEDYDLSVLAVVNEEGVLLGRITYDDIHDLIQDNATEQIYNLAGVDKEVEEESALKAAKARAFWLMINLTTSLISANIISLFSGEIEKLVALAVLMPIVASMGGNTGSQALAVTVRKLSLNEVEFKDAKKVILRESGISLLNGFIFAIIMSIIAFIWFKTAMLGLVIALSMLINLALAGFVGSFVPLTLKKFKIDPAVGSSVVITAITDALGFFSFLLLAKMMLL